MSGTAKNVTPIREAEAPPKISKETTAALKGIVSPKQIARLKKEIVLCPDIKLDVPFLECFICQSFLRRVKGELHCNGIRELKV